MTDFIRPEAVAVVCDRSLLSVRLAIRYGDLPKPTVRQGRALGWRLATLRDWRPDVAARIELLLQSPALTPPAA